MYRRATRNDDNISEEHLFTTQRPVSRTAPAPQWTLNEFVNKFDLVMNGLPKEFLLEFCSGDEET